MKQTDRHTPWNDSFLSICSLEIDEKCRFDFLAIYDGAATDSGLIQQVCGRITPAFQSSSNMMTVVLSTDYANSYRGFSARYTSVPLPAPEPNSKSKFTGVMSSVLYTRGLKDRKCIEKMKDFSAMQFVLFCKIWRM